MHQNNNESIGIITELSDVYVFKDLRSPISSQNTNLSVTGRHAPAEAETSEVQKTLNDMLAEFCSGRMRARKSLGIKFTRPMLNVYNGIESSVCDCHIFFKNQNTTFCL